MSSRIQNIIDCWYISEPALLKVFFSHELEINTSMSCPFRCGKGMIHYNPNIIERLNDEQLEKFLMAETIRIILKHPYDRQPDGCSRLAKSIGSNLVLVANYDFNVIGYDKPSRFSLPSNESYEWYSMHIERLLTKKEVYVKLVTVLEEQNTQLKQVGEENSESGEAASDNEYENNDLNDKGGTPNADECYVLTLADGTNVSIPKSSNNSTIQSQSINNHSNDIQKKSNLKFNHETARIDLAEMWEEDPLMSCTIDSLIDEIQISGKGWGSIPGNVVQTILANTKAKIDYRKVLSGFRASILSSKRRLTRMRPNRRSGFDNMGSIRQLSTNLLVAVDVSGSVSDETLAHFYSVISRVFKYGIERIDVVQFDCKLSEIVTLEKARKKNNITGRGGTDFQIVFDFAAKHPGYDGLIIFTDGCAPKPIKPKGMKVKVVWVCENKYSYENHKDWMKETGRCCMMQL